jgi:hypothetical protein
VSQTVGPAVVLLGVALIIVGVLIWAGGLGWFGRLPGDIRIERDSVHIYVPIVSMIVVSIFLTLVLALIRRFF